MHSVALLLLRSLDVELGSNCLYHMQRRIWGDFVTKRNVPLVPSLLPLVPPQCLTFALSLERYRKPRTVYAVAALLRGVRIADSVSLDYDCSQARAWL